MLLAGIQFCREVAGSPIKTLGDDDVRCEGLGDDDVRCEGLGDDDVRCEGQCEV